MVIKNTTKPSTFSSKLLFYNGSSVKMILELLWVNKKREKRGS